MHLPGRRSYAATYTAIGLKTCFRTSEARRISRRSTLRRYNNSSNEPSVNLALVVNPEAQRACFRYCV